MGMEFNGKYLERPQAVAAVNANGMVNFVTNDYGTGFIIGSADAGPHLAVVDINSAEEAKKTFGKGNLVEAANLAFNPSKTDGITGPSKLKMVNVKNAIQASIKLVSKSDGATVVTIYAKKQGPEGNNLKVGLAVVTEGESTTMKLTLSDGKDWSKELTNIPNDDTAADFLTPWLNNYGSEYFYAVNNGTKAQLNTTTNGALVNLTGGQFIEPTSQDWQDALNLMKKEEVTIGTVLTSDASVHAMAEAHASSVSALGKRPRRMILGGAAGETSEQIVTRATNLKSQYAVLVGNGVVRYDTNSNLTTFEPFMAAAQMVGMACATEPHMPLTFKYINAQGLEQEFDEDTLDELHAAGVFLFEHVENKGYRIVDDLTTYTMDDKYKHLSVCRIYDWCVSNTSKLMEDKFVGLPGDDNAPSAIKASLIDKILIKAKDKGYIHGGKDETGTYQPPFRKVAVIIDGEICGATYEVSPTEQIGFIAVMAYAKRTTLSA